MHSGVFGGTVHEGMADLMYMMNTLVDKDGKILVEGIQDEVAPVTPGKYKCNVGYGFFRWGMENGQTQRIWGIKSRIFYN